MNSNFNRKIAEYEIKFIVYILPFKHMCQLLKREKNVTRRFECSNVKILRMCACICVLLTISVWEFKPIQANKSSKLHGNRFDCFETFNRLWVCKRKHCSVSLVLVLTLAHWHKFVYLYTLIAHNSILFMWSHDVKPPCGIKREREWPIHINKHIRINMHVTERQRAITVNNIYTHNDREKEICPSVCCTLRVKESKREHNKLV